MTINFFPLSRSKNLVTQEVDGEVLAYDSVTNKTLCLNRTSALIWHLCDGTKSISEINQLVGAKLHLSNAEELVQLAMDEFKRENLLTDYDEAPYNFSGSTRRDVIKRLGLTSLIALPILSAVIAPTAARAASGVCINSSLRSCRTNADCNAGDSCDNNCCVTGGAIGGGGITTGGGSVGF